jgi:hypothetical protein
MIKSPHCRKVAEFLFYLKYGVVSPESGKFFAKLSEKPRESVAPLDWTGKGEIKLV